jgi:tagatose-6-phosphate ketose/aldose isomerase
MISDERTSDAQLQDSPELDAEISAWIARLSEDVPALARLLSCPVSRQLELGYYHVVREICQQPLTWPDTAARAIRSQPAILDLIAGVDGTGPARSIVFTGSGSSQYVGDCAAFGMEDAMAFPALSVPSGELLVHGGSALSLPRPSLLVSLARSGDSPESCAVVDWCLTAEPESRHLAITCNRTGRLATDYRHERRMHALVLDDRTCDRSLVMTSSFTNLLVASWGLCPPAHAGRYRRTVEALAQLGRDLLLRHTEGLAQVARREYRTVMYLASGAGAGAARECALKMLEITAGKVRTLAETYLGLRHGPMSAVHRDTLVVCFLSSAPQVSPYELDLIEELKTKRLGAGMVFVGDSLPPGLGDERDYLVQLPALQALGDRYAPALFVMAGQLLALFRSLADGFRPDSPSGEGIINRVVRPFPIPAFGAGRSQ